MTRFVFGPVEKEEVREARHGHAEVGRASPPHSSLSSTPPEPKTLMGATNSRRGTRPVDQYVRRVLLAVGRAHTVRGDLGDRCRDEVDVGPAQGRRPTPVVAQRPLGEGREVRHHLLEEGVVLDLGPQDVEQHGAHEVVGGAHRFGVLVPVGIDPGGPEQPLVHQPELPHPVPAPVARQERQQLVEAGGKGSP